MDGLVAGALGRRHASGGCDRVPGGDVVRSRGGLSQRGFACGGAVYAGESVSYDVRGDHRGQERVHTAVEDQFSAVPADGEERSTTGIQVRAVYGGDVVRAFQ